MPDKAKRKNAGTEWFLRGDHDLQSARILVKQGGHTDTIAVLLQQATEKYLKGYLLTQGWRLKKIHDLEVLVSEAITHDKGFKQFLDFARKAAAFYLEVRYPPGPPTEYSEEEISDMLAQTEKLIAKIEEALG